MTSTTPETQVRTGSRFEQVVLIGTMAVGSIAMWAGSPVFWLYVAGRISKVSSSSMQSLLLVIIGIPITMILIGKLLSRVDHRYTAKFSKGEGSDQHAYARWLHTMRGGTEGEAPTMLEKIMVISVGLALLCVGVWYVFFSAGSAAKNS